MPPWLNNFLSGLDPREMLILNRLFLDNEKTNGVVEYIINDLPQNEEEEQLISAEDEDAIKDVILEREAAKIEGPITEAHFVYPQSLKNVARVQAFRNFLYSKISEWKF